MPGKGLVYGVCVSTWVSAALRIKDLGGRAAKLHGHDYLVVVCAESDRVENGIVIDHDALLGILASCSSELDYSNLNTVLGTENATAEQVAHHIYQCLAERIRGAEPVLVAVCTPRGRCSYIRARELPLQLPPPAK